jgi:hypothetical protein
MITDPLVATVASLSAVCEYFIGKATGPEGLRWITKILQ